MSELEPKFGIVCFDVDSTLTSLEGIDFLAGDNQEIMNLTEMAMNGEMPIEEVYGRRLEIVKPDAGRLDELGKQYVETIVPGMESVVRDLIDGNVDVRLVTAGIEQSVFVLADHLGVPRRSVYAVPVRLDQSGAYEDFDRSAPTARAGGKRTVLRNIRVRNKGKMAFVGDGGTDLETKGVVDTFIGFGVVEQRSIVRENADVFVTTVEELRSLLFGEAS